MRGEQAKALQDALLSAYPDEEALREMLLFKLDLKLPEITQARSQRVKVLDVMQDLESQGRLEELVMRAYELKARNPKLREVVQQYWPALLASAVPVPAVGSKPPPLTDYTLDPTDWDELIDAILEKKCTPVIGPGTCRGLLPSNAELALEWAEHYQYPFADRAELARVSQFLALTHFRLMPHKELHRRYTAATVHPPDFESLEEPHALLADLNLPLYLTTNYDDFMMKALVSRNIKATRAFPRWKDKRIEPPVAASPGAGDATLVYHLFGHHELPESLNLTEDDGFSLHAAAITNQNLFPLCVNTALADHTLLFIGHQVFDWEFRVLVHTLLQPLTAQNPNFGVVAMQLPTETLRDDQLEQVEKYLKNVLENTNFKIHIFWGGLAKFVCELRTRWEEQRRHAVVAS